MKEDASCKYPFTLSIKKHVILSVKPTKIFELLTCLYFDLEIFDYYYKILFCLIGCMSLPPKLSF